MAREESVTTKELGIAVVGSGRIGTLRARLAAKHPAVRFVAVSDKDPANAKKLAELSGAHFHSADNNEVIALAVHTVSGELRDLVEQFPGIKDSTVDRKSVV